MRQKTSVSRGSDRASLDEDIEQLRKLDLKGLRARWRGVTGRDAPPHLSPQLLFNTIAYRIQAEALGDLDAETLRFLKTLSGARSDTEAAPLTATFDQRRRLLSPGTVLTREWNGQMHRVMVVDNGFSWDGRTHDSLSTIAFAITGTRWNGPRFFGLRDKKLAKVPT